MCKERAQSGSKPRVLSPLFVEQQAFTLSSVPIPTPVLVAVCNGVPGTYQASYYSRMARVQKNVIAPRWFECGFEARPLPLRVSIDSKLKQQNRNDIVVIAPYIFYTCTYPGTDHMTH